MSDTPVGELRQQLAVRVHASQFAQRKHKAIYALVRTQAVKSLPAKLILCAYGLLVLVIAALYTANATAQLTVQSLRSDIRSIDDLRGEHWVLLSAVSAGILSH